MNIGDVVRVRPSVGHGLAGKLGIIEAIVPEDPMPLRVCFMDDRRFSFKASELLNLAGA